MHTKAEPYNPKLKHVRLINSRCDAMKVWFGPPVRSMEAEVYKLPYFVKHIPVIERPAALQSLERAGARYFVIDYTAFESHMTPALQASTELLLAEYMLSRFPGLAHDIALADSGSNHCYHRNAGVRVGLEGRRMSGDMWTSLFNGWTNFSVVTYVMSRLGHVLDVTYTLRVEGDDCLLVVYRGATPSVVDFSSRGFTVKLVEVPDTGSCGVAGDVRGVAFCGLVHADGQTMRDPGPFIAKFSWAADAETAGPERRRGLLAAKAMSALAETPQCPIIGAVARAALEATKGSTPVFVLDGYHQPRLGDVVPDYSPSRRAREKFALLFGISPAEQERVEREVLSTGSVTPLLAVLTPSCDQLRYWSGWVEEG